MAHLVAVRRLAIAVGVAMLALCPSLAQAQSAIAGQVRDSTGALLPGAVVEASSAALIEGQRSVVTNGQGQYSIVDLRPGIYTVTFSLEGFSRVIRDQIELPSNFTATVDVEMSLTALQETVTVSGQSPLVDVQRTERTTVFSRELMSAIPSSNNVWSFAQLAPGVSMNGVDVAGSSNGSDRELSAHGLSSTHTVIAVDGINANAARADGRAQFYFQDLANQEVTFDTSGGSAEISSGGLRINMIPRDGGNRPSGAAFAGGAPGAWQADNFTQRLKDLGLTSVDKIERIFDYGGTQGGPIVENRLWYVVSARYWGTYDLPSDNFLDDGSRFRREGDRWSVLPRVTAQLTSRDKVSVHYERTAGFRGPKLQAKYPVVINGIGNDPETAGTWRNPGIPDWMFLTKWTSTVSNRFLIEANAGRNFLNSQLNLMPGVEAPVGSTDWFNHVAKTDTDLGVNWDSRQGLYHDWAWKNFWAASASYVTGTHNMKVGIQNSWGRDEREQQYNGHISLLTYRSRVPVSAGVTNAPALTTEKSERDMGVYLQDRWTHDRLSVNGGIRFEWLNSSVAEQDAAAGRFVGARHFEAVENVPDWFNVSPRLGVAYDLFGNSRTAVKFSVGQYSTPLTTSLARDLNPLAIVVTTVPWTDRDIQGRPLATNSNGIAEDNELDLTRLPQNFGTRSLSTLDPDLERETNREVSASVQHQLTPRTSISFAWYRRSYQNKRTIDNLERDLNDFRPATFVSPFNGEIITVYDIVSTTELSRVNNIIRNADFTEVYNGYDVAAEHRIPGGGRVFGNVSTQRIIQNDCAQNDDPNLLRFCDRSAIPSLYNSVPLQTDLKLGIALPIGKGFQFSSTFVSIGEKGKFANGGYGFAPNFIINRTTTYTAADCAGRPCTPGAVIVPGMVSTSINVPLAPAGTEIFLPRLNQLDMGVKKSFKLQSTTWEPRLDVFNVTNEDTETSYRSTTWGTPTYLIPGTTSSLSGTSGILVARMIRVSLQVKW